MRHLQFNSILFILFAHVTATQASTTVTALDAHAPPLAPPAKPALQQGDSKKLPNLENNDKLWALLQYEAKYGKIEYTSLRKFGDYSNTNLRAVKAVGFNLASFNFKDADLRGADLRQADLHGANFLGADLREAVLLSANTQGALFNDRTLFPYSKEEALQRGWKEMPH